MDMWQSVLRQNFTRCDALCAFLELSDAQKKEIGSIASFPINVPYRLAQKMEKKSLDCPIVRQFLPTKTHQNPPAHFCQDPVEDQTFQITPKLLKKYSQRVLLMPTSACAMHCRYCFRQNYPYEKDKELTQELLYLTQSQEVKEVILSGGDPLSLPDNRLIPLLQAIDAITHIQRIRIHSRFIVGIPERVTPALVAAFGQLKSKLYFVTHVNHPKELDMHVLEAIRKIQLQGAVVLNQSVLLKGVNNCFETLLNLCNLLIDNAVIPYYLHQLDPVVGSEDFWVCPQEGKKLIEQLKKELPGYGVPKYVAELAGMPSKSEL